MVPGASVREISVFFISAYEDLLLWFARVRDAGRLHDIRFRRTRACSTPGDGGQHQGNDVAGRIQGCRIE